MTDEPAQEPRGGLASEAIGGLSKFLGDVNRGIEVVMSHPLYQRAWSGFVSGQTGDPTAGPRALAQMQQSAIDQRTQAALMDRRKIDWQREDEAYTTGRENALLRQRNIERLQQALAGGDQYGVRSGLAALDPVKAAEGFLAPPKTPTIKPVMTPEGPRYVKAEDAIGMRPYERGGIVVGVDANGNPIVKIGESGDMSGLTNTVKSGVQEKQFNAERAISRLESIRESFRPEFLTFGSKAERAALSVQAKAGLPLSDSQTKTLQDFAEFRVAAFNNMNTLLNELSGAAISPAEAERLKEELPDPGTGIWDGDDPVTFQAEMDAIARNLEEQVRQYDAKLKGVPYERPSGVSRPPKPDPLVNGRQVEWKWDPASKDWYYEDGS